MREVLYATEPNFLDSYLRERVRTSAEDMRVMRDLFPNISEPGSPEAVDEIYTVEGDRAKIKISGPMSPNGPDFWDLFMGYGGVSYATIIAAVNRAKSDMMVKGIDFLADTPGGTIDGADLTYQAIRDAGKPSRCIISNMLASAGVYIMAPCKRREASAPTDEIGSIGVIVAQWDFSGAYSLMGIKRQEVRSSNAPKKAKDLSTKDGRDIMQDRIDAAERIFYQRLSESLGVTTDYIAENFGQGALMVARDPSDAPDAIKVGLIDGLTSDSVDFTTTTSPADPLGQALPPAQAGNSQEVTYMTLSELLAQNPAAAAEVDKLKTDAKAQGRAELQAEMDKVSAKARPILESKAYGEGVKMLAVDCILGKSDIAALESAVAVLDLNAEDKKSKEAQAETAAIGETNASAPQGEANVVAKDAGLIASFFKKDGK